MNADNDVVGRCRGYVFWYVYINQYIIYYDYNISTYDRIWYYIYINRFYYTYIIDDISWYISCQFLHITCLHDVSWAMPCLMPRNSKKLAGGLCLFGTSPTFDAEVGSEATTTHRWSSRVLGAVLHRGRGEQWGRQWQKRDASASFFWWINCSCILYWFLAMTHENYWEFVFSCVILNCSESFRSLISDLFLNLGELAFSNSH